MHTHVKADITDFPAYGTTAGTICEGNDSRLSDARTPVAHTHVTADVTDLLNSNHTWSGENTFTKPCKTLGKKLLTDITDLDDAYYNGEVCKFDPNTLHNPTGAYGNVLTINNAVNVPDNVYNSWITQIATAPDGSYLGFRNRSNGNAWTSWTSILTESRARPTVTNTYDLGSSSYQWNNLYANKVNTQSVNGINPGALSLPNTRSGVQIDITNWDNRASPNGLIGNFTAPVDCIVSIQMTRDVDWGVWVICGNFRQSFRSADNNGTHLIFLTFPVAKGEGIGIYCPPISSDETPITFIANKQLYFPCLGNV